VVLWHPSFLFGTLLVVALAGPSWEHPEVTDEPLGGNAVKVMGEYGYVHNAHLSAFGQLGPVTKGTVIGTSGRPGTPVVRTTTRVASEQRPRGRPASVPNARVLGGSSPAGRAGTMHGTITEEEHR